jgi:hypothetical protein
MRNGRAGNGRFLKIFSILGPDKHLATIHVIFPCRLTGESKIVVHDLRFRGRFTLIFQVIILLVLALVLMLMLML